MKKLLLAAGIICIIACVLSLSFASLNLFGYYHLLDGSADLYVSMHQRMKLFSAIGIAFAAAGAACLIIRAKA